MTDEQMAVFIIRSLGILAPPTPASQRFTDVPSSSPFFPFIDHMGVRQITTGCGTGTYCPGDFVTRGQMAVFLVRASGL